MDFGDAIRDGFSKYATFSGRSSRSAYWWWFLFAILVSILGNVLNAIGNTWVVGVILGLALLLPNLAVTVRRYHDAGHSGWWLLLLIVPLVGVVVLLIFTLTDSKPPNEWGAGPDNGATTFQLDSSGQAMPAPQSQPIDQMPPPPPPPQEPPPPSPPSSWAP